MSPPTQTRQWLLNHKPANDPVLDGPDATFKLVTTDLPPLGENQVLIQAMYISNDPAQRTWIYPNADPARLYMTPVPLNSPMTAVAICRIVESRAAHLSTGTLVMASLGWSEYGVVDAGAVTPIEEIEGVNITHFLGSLGFPGFTAYYGLKEVAKAGKNDRVVISGAAGATGSMAVQIAKKILGCKEVIGIAGTDEKCKWVEEIGADICLNYKKDSFKEDLVKATEGFVEVYFDNVGGEILDLMLGRIARHGREVISMRISIKGFIVLDFVDHQAEMTKLFIEEVKKGTIVVGDESETVVDTKFEDIPKTWMMLFSGGNKGKLVTKLVG
ncbi:alcohol dehydrogenase superfamily zinc-containing protein [Rutstroemia sp. NJR-2017a BVV2]|nr:alcohol dehydrogenase superfamily zinc-containing protein [Rutstroemia sp. NJR-2017a BVV2]PQE19709.1 alcohol dehydrogenase superfamily zinc-containing protein [Rutstroemia sp. NJR-2017a BVV2]